MLFLGTKPYPQEDSFESFLSSNGGSSNAYTDSLDTVYYFEIEVDSDTRFLEGLKRFGAFFSSPLFTEAATGRELMSMPSRARMRKTCSQKLFATFSFLRLVQIQTTRLASFPLATNKLSSRIRRRRTSTYEPS